MRKIHDGRQFLTNLGFDCSKPIKNGDFTGKFLVGIVFECIEFQNCNFYNSDLSYATFNNCSLYRCKFENAMLYVTRIKSSVLIRTNFSGAYLYGVQIKDVEPTLASFDDLQFEPMFRQTQLDIENTQNDYEINSPCCVAALAGKTYTCNGETISYREFKKGEDWLRKAETYNQIKRLLREGGYIARSAEFYFLERQARRRSRVSYFHKIAEGFYEIICGYGERPWRSVISLLLVWLGFAFVYPMLPVLQSHSNVTISSKVLAWTPFTSIKGLLETSYDSLYFSAVTMTTLGYGDGIPLGLARGVVILQTFCGMLFFAILVATVTRKVIRD